jgi:aspartyl-tRNA(Asn)/glutamyl-tRNA(Gln) amidotransferase subunit A
LRTAGAIPFGKTNMDEFAMGSSTENSGIKPTHNPWDLSRVPGGSSGGSAAAVAADAAFGALGTDTGGSIRQPAALSGVVGVKPTYGRVSRFGVTAFASSLDQVGSLTKTVRDSAMLMHAIAGHDPQDSTSLNESVGDYVGALDHDLRGVRIGLPKEYMIAGIDPQVKSAIDAAVKHFGSFGAEIVEVSLPHTEYGRTPSTGWQFIIFWQRPKRPQTSPASMACVMGIAPKTPETCSITTDERAKKVLVRR